MELFLHLQPRQQDLLATNLGLSTAGVTDYIRADISGLGAVAFDNRGVGDAPDLQIAGEVLLYRRLDAAPLVKGSALALGGAAVYFAIGWRLRGKE